MSSYEFARVSPRVEYSTLINDEILCERLTEASQVAYRALFDGSVHSRITVKGVKQQDLKDRLGTIYHFDEAKGKFKVGLDSSKKGKNVHFMYFAPENLEAVPLDTSRKGKGKKKSASVSLITVFVPNLYMGLDLKYELSKHTVSEMTRKSDINLFLANLMAQKDEDERIARENAEFLRQQL